MIKCHYQNKSKAMVNAMESIFDQWDLWQNLLDMLEKQFGDRCEFVLHDLTKDYNHTIVDIRNGYITGRKIGDCGSNIGLEVLKGTVANGNKYNYITHTRDGKIFRSSTLFLRDNSGAVIGSFCINLDITPTVKFEEYLKNYNQYGIKPESEQGSEEIFVNDVNQLFDYICQEAQRNIGKNVDDMTREDKMAFIRYLDNKGAFLINRSSEKTWEYLKISKFTFYNYLDTVRSNKG